MVEKANFYAEVEKFPVIPGSDAFIVSSTFLKQIDRSEEDGNTPSQVNNKGLIRQKKFKTDIKWKQDFDIFSPEVWDYIQLHYGGGPEICVKVLPDGSPELYPLVFSVQYKKQVKSFTFSRMIETSEFLKKAMSSFSIPSNYDIVIQDQKTQSTLEMKKYLGETLNNATKIMLTTAGPPKPIGSNHDTTDNNNTNTKTDDQQNQANPSDINDITAVKQQPTIIQPTQKKGKKPHIGKNAKRAAKQARIQQQNQQYAKAMQQQQTDPKNAKPCGLRNIGNTCYMNSALQSLLSLQLFVDNMQTILSESEKPVLTSTFANFVSGVKNGSADPGPVKRCMGKVCPLFSSYGQQDSQEFYSFLIDKMHDESKKNDSYIEHLFFGKFKTLTKCAECGHETDVVEAFTTVSLPIASARKIYLIPYDTTIQMKKVGTIQKSKEYVIFSRSKKGLVHVDDFDPFAIDHLVFEKPNEEGHHLLIKLIDKDDGKNISFPILVTIPSKTIEHFDSFDEEQKDKEIKDIIWQKAKNLWLSQKRNDAFETMIIENDINNICDMKEYEKIVVRITGKGMNDLRSRAVEGDLSLDDLIAGFFGTTQLDERNQWKCEKCQNSTCALRKCYFEHLPDIVVFQLKRFLGTGRKSRRDNTPIDIPLTLSLQSLENKDKEELYELRSISNHAGTLSFGHYTAIGKRNEQWYSFNDSSVCVTSPPVGKSTAAYLLFYSKPVPVEKPKEEENKQESVPEEKTDDQHTENENQDTPSENEQKENAQISQ